MRLLPSGNISERVYVTDYRHMNCLITTHLGLRFVDEGAQRLLVECSVLPCP
jgi:hypothetical protein